MTMAMPVSDAIDALPITLKDQQKEVMLALANGENVFAVLPTGYGKSICYGLFGELMDMVHPGEQHIVLVISPLKALMADQISRWTDLNIKCAAITTETSIEDTQSVLDCERNLVFMSPEVALEKKWRSWIKQIRNKICLLAVDEVHCLTSWGNTFREDYLKLPILRGQLSQVPILLLTATVTPKMVADILRILHLHPSKVKMVATLPDRPNILLEFQRAKTKNISMAAEWLVPHLRQGRTAGKVIVFCRTMSDARSAYNDIMTGLGNDAWSSSEHTVWNRFVDMFHSHIHPESQKRILDAFVTPQSHIRCVVATVAFGLGVEVPDERHVLHWGPASDILSLWQEIGRCARDGGPGKATTIIYPGSVNKAFIDGDYIDIMKQIDAGSCIRKCIFRHLHIKGMQDYGQACERKGCCSFCIKRFGQ